MWRHPICWRETRFLFPTARKSHHTQGESAEGAQTTQYEPEQSQGTSRRISKRGSNLSKLFCKCKSFVKFKQFYSKSCAISAAMRKLIMLDPAS